MSLALPEEMGVDLDSVDFLLGGSSLNIMATKRIEAGDKYLWLVNACTSSSAWGHTIIVAKSKQYQQNYGDIGFQFERLVTGERLEGPHDVRKHEHLTRRTIDSWNVLFAAEIDALDVDGVVEVKSGNPRNFAMKEVLSMLKHELGEGLWELQHLDTAPEWANGPVGPVGCPDADASDYGFSGVIHDGLARQRTPDELLEEIFQQFEASSSCEIGRNSGERKSMQSSSLEAEDASDDIVRQPLDLADVHFAQMDKADFEVELLKKVLNSLGHPERLTLRSFQQTMKEVLAGWCAREQVQEALRLAQVFDPKKIGVLPRPSIVKMVQLWSKSCFSEKQLEEILKDVPSNSQGLEYRYIIPSLLPLKAKYDLEDPKSLAKFLIDANIRLVRAEYLYKLLRSNRCMPRVVSR
ncbi:Uncharacterized protein SCF082_LOCUS43396 [Durusdinium trenchii]|uniref:Uncharacterized protein n=1 Tax=Durusdinium trenchii TaxID=1381693 RepID=A0ABP0QV78_9DINO